MKSVIPVLCCCALLFLILPASAASPSETVVAAKILSVEYDGQTGSYIVAARVLEGSFRGGEVSFRHTPIEYTLSDFTLRKGLRVLLLLRQEGDALSASLEYVDRSYYLRILTLIFAGLLLLFGRMKGLVSLVSLGVSAFCVFCIFMPLILGGYRIIPVTILCCVLTVSVSFLILAGWTWKCLSAIAGTLGGMMCAFILIVIFSNLTCITGSISEDVTLLVYEQGVELDFSKLFISGVMIGTIGVLMDVSMSITSVVLELKRNSTRMEFKALVGSGLNVGKDVMATMVNTLILAYAGTSLPLFFWIYGSALTGASAMNLEEVASEVLRSLCGSIGLVMAVPITSLIASYIACHQRKPSAHRHRMIQRNP